MGDSRGILEHVNAQLLGSITLVVTPSRGSTLGGLRLSGVVSAAQGLGALRLGSRDVVGIDVPVRQVHDIDELAAGGGGLGVGGLGLGEGDSSRGDARGRALLGEKMSRADVSKKFRSKLHNMRAGDEGANGLRITYNAEGLETDHLAVSAEEVGLKSSLDQDGTLRVDDTGALWTNADMKK